jgi:hypothetical protein
MVDDQVLSGAREVLVVCDGNTCRSPTLMLLLRYRARQLGLARSMHIESAGLGESAANGDPMRKVAQRAAAQATRLLNPGISAASINTDALAALRKEAMQHSSRQVAVDDESFRIGTLLCLLKREALAKLDPDGVLKRIESMIWLPKGDKAIGCFANAAGTNLIQT